MHSQSSASQGPQESPDSPSRHNYSHGPLAAPQSSLTQNSPTFPPPSPPPAHLPLYHTADPALYPNAQSTPAHFLSVLYTLIHYAAQVLFHLLPLILLLFHPLLSITVPYIDVPYNTAH